ncbi:MAG: ribosome maturation factor RimM [Acidobacteria bacterium]|nr:ribosome maturation factor RimM [Acidobacteriota bacterium]
MSARWDEMALVGRVARAHGLRGQVVVNPETDFPEERFRPGAELFFERDGQMAAAIVGTVRFHRGRPIVALRGIETIGEAGALAGLELRVPRDRLVPLPDGTYYRHDLVGCRVETSGGAPIGIVREVEGGAGGSRLVVEDPAGADVLIPLAAEICTVIDPAARRIVVDPPDGLLEANR